MVREPPESLKCHASKGDLQSLAWKQVLLWLETQVAEEAVKTSVAKTWTFGLTLQGTRFSPF